MRFSRFLGRLIAQALDFAGPRFAQTPVVPTKLLARPRARRESALCFCAPRFATRTARLIGHGRLWRTGAFMMVAWFSGKCCILERSTTARKRRGAGRLR